MEEIKKENLEKDYVILEMKKQIEKFEDREVKNEDNAEKLHRLFQMGIIDKDGELVDQRSQHE
jgi:hypothetical protein